MTKISTLAYITKENQVLLGLKKRGFGTGKLNGYGGKVEVENATILVPNIGATILRTELQAVQSINIFLM